MQTISKLKTSENSFAGISVEEVVKQTGAVLTESMTSAEQLIALHGKIGKFQRIGDVYKFETEDAESRGVKRERE